MAEKLPKVFGKDGLYGIVFYNSSFAGGRLHDYEVANLFGSSVVSSIYSFRGQSKKVDFC